MSATQPHQSRRAWVSFIIAGVFIVIALAAFLYIPSTINTGHTQVAPIPAVTSTPPPAPTATPKHSATALLLPNGVSAPGF